MVTHPLNVSSCQANLCDHDEPQEIGDHSYCQDEELPAIFTAEGGGIHVHHSCHQALHTHKLEISHIRLIKMTASLAFLLGC